MDRKQARADFLERKPDAGIYALRLRAGLWVGAASRLTAAENRLRFTLSTGTERNPALAAAYADEGDFSFEVLETLDPKLSAMRRQDLLKERLAHWLDKTGGQPV
ncbi:GIY-YIG nuclease family protein [Frigidibacter sp. ROC022]|uniref:GIY-YIG nuclease family protein n=1 Tax=Frigidibacter sp. ROC022 TaxID=2971796 RepID=UPI00215B2A92|nr:GIY-YIG nuclease family protein [Frigidibacter sp. ROC022]MCR8723847.1 GIY-YIG nuclease family protein [Frigidibacter sp. ROC022]